jgi:hypothetical protein
VIKLIKVIGSSLLKEATQDDLAVMSQAASGGNNDTNSEFARLQRLPGFSRLQRQLFFNMMTAKPDTSDQNIRIQNIKPKKPHTGKHKRVIQQESPAVSENPSETNILATTNTNTHKDAYLMDEEDMEPTMGRSTIKSISRLIVERDTAKLKPPSTEQNTLKR